MKTIDDIYENSLFLALKSAGADEGLSIQAVYNNLFVNPLSSLATKDDLSDLEEAVKKDIGSLDRKVEDLQGDFTRESKLLHARVDSALEISKTHKEHLEAKIDGKKDESKESSLDELMCCRGIEFIVFWLLIGVIWGIILSDIFNK